MTSNYSNIGGGGVLVYNNGSLLGKGIILNFSGAGVNLAQDSTNISQYNITISDISGSSYSNSNLGSGQGVAAAQNGNNFTFRSILGTGSVAIQSGSTDITISGTIYSLANIGAGEGIYVTGSGPVYQVRSLVGLGGTSIVSGSNTISISSSVGATYTDHQDIITTEAVSGSDTPLASTLAAAPVSTGSVSLYFNGAFVSQGAGRNYTVSGQTITWLGSTGIAPRMEITDELVALYRSSP